MEGSTGAERKEFWGVEGQKEFAPEEMEHIQVCWQVLSLDEPWHKNKESKYIDYGDSLTAEKG